MEVGVEIWEVANAIVVHLIYASVKPCALKHALQRANARGQTLVFFPDDGDEGWRCDGKVT